MGLLLNDGREREERRGEARDERELTPSRVCSHPHVRNPDKSSDIPLVVSFGGGCTVWAYYRPKTEFCRWVPLARKQAARPRRAFIAVTPQIHCNPSSTNIVIDVILVVIDADN